MFNKLKVKKTNDKILFFELDGDFMINKDMLFSEFAKKLFFPKYFGKNWDAFEECINDLSWLRHDAEIIKIYIKNFDKILFNFKDDQKIFYEILSDAKNTVSILIDFDLYLSI